MSVPKQLEQLTKELEVKVYTGLSSPKIFQFLFDCLAQASLLRRHSLGSSRG